MRSVVIHSALLFFCVALLVTGCTRTSDPNIGRQIQGNQGLLLVLQNANELSDLYLPYAGSIVPGSRTSTGGTVSGQSGGTVQIGEMNLLLHNVGGSATAGHLFVSGYDPNLFEVRSRIGETPIYEGGGDRSCVHNVIITTDGRYDVAVFCQKVEGISVGGRVTPSGSGTIGSITLGNLPLDQWMDQVASGVTGQNVDWFTQNGFFGQGRVDCTVNTNGGDACRVIFGNPSLTPNRALYGYLLLNMLYGEITGQASGSRMFPPNFAVGEVLNGVSDLYPSGDSMYVNYDIFVNRNNWPPLLNDIKQRFQVTACYYYTTTITPTVCVDPDPSTRVNDPCDAASPIVFRKTQGAPIQVTRIQPRSIPGGSIFEIELRHVGSGQFWIPGSLEQCGPYSPVRPERARQDVVQLLDARVAGELNRLRCTPEDSNGNTIIRFQNGVGKLSCFYPYLQTPLMTRQAFQTALTLEFGYLYQNVIVKDVVIHRI